MVTRPQLSALPNGKHHFGHGLYLYVRGGSRLWLLIFMRHPTTGEGQKTHQRAS